jgi:4'-phosphopantetheinyl transferase N-terminal domain
MRKEAPFPVNSSRLLLLERSTSLKRRKPNHNAGRDRLRLRVAPCCWNQEGVALVLAKLLMTTRALVSATTVPCLFVSQIRTHSERFILQCPLRDRRILPLRPSPGTTIFFSASTSAETTRNNRNPLSEQPTLYSSLSLCSRKLFPRAPVEPAVTALSSIPKENRATLSYVQELFDILLPQGQCVGLQFPAELPASQFGLEQSHWLTQFLHPNEIDHGLRECHAIAVRETFYLGRLAMRRALWGQLQDMNDPTNSSEESFWTCRGGAPFPTARPSALEDNNNRQGANFRDHCILKDAHGRPTLPRGYVGSISHKNRTAVALVARDDHQGDAATVPSYGIGIDIESIDPRRSRIAAKVLTPSEIKQLGRIPVGSQRTAVHFDNTEAAVAHVA